jgi:nucleotide-binding universal stress UspA family protein
MPNTLKSLVDLGCLVRVAEDTPLVAARQAIALALAYEAHLSISLIVQTFSAPYSPLWSGIGAGMAREINDKAVAKAESIAETLRAEINAAGVAGEVEVLAGPVDEIAAKAAEVARAVDLVVLDQPQGALDSTEALLEEALFRSGRPVLVVSPAKAPLESVKKVLLGWDGSAHAVRACAEVLGLFPNLEEIEVVTVTGESKRAASLPAVNFTRHLARKGVKAVLTDIALENKSIGALLDERAQATGADVIAMGAFGRSRLREFLLGGTTVELTQNAKTTLLLVS